MFAIHGDGEKGPEIIFFSWDFESAYGNSLVTRWKKKERVRQLKTFTVVKTRFDRIKPVSSLHFLYSSFSIASFDSIERREEFLQLVHDIIFHVVALNLLSLPIKTRAISYHKHLIKEILFN